MTTVRALGPPLTESRMASFEQELGATLPNPYRQFLMRTNGGRPPLGKDTMDIEGLAGSPTDVQVFFGLDASAESGDLLWHKETLHERIPDNLLAIACDSFGSVYCLSLHGADRGAVSFCDLQSVAFDYEAVPNIYPLAPDFDAFLNKLREFRDEEPT